MLFHSPPGVLFTVPSRYWSTIGRWRYLAFGRGRPSFPPGCPCPVVLRSRPRAAPPSPTGLSPPLARRSRTVRLKGRLLTRRPVGSPARTVLLPRRRIGLPATQRRRFGLVPVRSPLLGECFSVPRGTEMFQFPRFPRHGGLACASVPSPGITRAGLPHSDTPGSQRASPLPGAFRRLAASFLGLHRQGIHRAPSSAWPVPAPPLPLPQPAAHGHTEPAHIAA